MAFEWELNARHAQLNATAALLNSGTIVIRTAAHAELATGTFGATAFAAADAGEAAANPITKDSDATGDNSTDAAEVLLVSSASATVGTGTVTVTGGGGDLTGASLRIPVGSEVSFPTFSLVHTNPA